MDDRYDSWDAFCNDVFGRCGKSDTILKMLYAAGGMAMIFVILSMLGFGVFTFISWLVGFLITPVGWVVVAVFGAAAIPVLKYLFSERRTLEPILRRLTEAKPIYDRIAAALRAGAEERKRLIDLLFEWVVNGGVRPDFGGDGPPEGPAPDPVPA